MDIKYKCLKKLNFEGYLNGLTFISAIQFSFHEIKCLYISNSYYLYFI